MARSLYSAFGYFDSGSYTKALNEYAKVEAFFLKFGKPLPFKTMVEMAICYQELGREFDATSYMELSIVRIESRTKLNANEKAYLFQYCIQMAEPFELRPWDIPERLATFRLAAVSKRLRKRYPIAHSRKFEPDGIVNDD